MITTILYGIKKDETRDYMEEVLYECDGYTNKEKLMKQGEKWAEKNGYNRIRISEVKLSKPNFIKAINI
tara:strand:+ start:95 stop:301 length:207 start_codon:yes stop_codon:yes gene_type:complete